MRINKTIVAAIAVAALAGCNKPAANNAATAQAASGPTSGVNLGAGWVRDIINATIGAVIILVILSLIRR